MIFETTCCFPKQLRLLTPKQFSHVFKFGEKLRCRTMMLFIASNHLTHARIGFAISKKRVKKAVARNRIKRVIRENFRKNISYFAPVDIIVLAAGPLDAMNNSRIGHLFLDCLKNANNYH